MSFKYWQNRILISILVGYAGFYLIRNNIFIAIPKIQHEFSYSNFQIGYILTLSHMLYGFGKCISGIISDRFNPRYFMAFGLFMSCLMNFCMGFSNTFWMFLTFWAFNAAFQSMGFAPCAKLLTHWFNKKELGTKWALSNTSQQIGMLGMYLLAGFALELGQWRYIFVIPACIALIITAFIFLRLQDTPESLGFKVSYEESTVETEDLSFKELLMQKVFCNSFIWYLSIANMFLYFTRISIISWAPKFLLEFKGNRNAAIITHTAILELAGMLGGIAAGYLSDKIFHGNRNLVAVLCMLGVSLGIFCLWKIPNGTGFIQFFIMLIIGFCITGPQILIGVSAADFASKKAAGAASGFTGVFGYIGSAFTGIGMGYILDRFGWNTFFYTVFVSSLITCFSFSLIWVKYLVAKLEEDL